MNPVVLVAVYTVAIYVFGSIPFGLLVGKLLKGIDIRELGSGNIGAANAFRALGPVGGVLVLLFDVSKGLLPVYVSQFLMQGESLYYLQVWSGFVAIMGHNFSLFLRFKGGKGIATSLGVIIALNWKVALICFGVWLLMVLITKYSSVGSLSGSLMFPVMMVILKQPVPYIVLGTAACLSAFYSHRGNLKKLLEGKELKITEKPGSGAGAGKEKSLTGEDEGARKGDQEIQG